MYQFRNYSDIQHEKDIAHDRAKIEASFHSGIAPKNDVEKFFKKYCSPKLLKKYNH